MINKPLCSAPENVSSMQKKAVEKFVDFIFFPNGESHANPIEIHKTRKS
jgi:hypothetical protein